MKETLIDLGKSLGYMVGITVGVVAWTLGVNYYPGIVGAITLFAGWMALFWMYRKRREIDSRA